MHAVNFDALALRRRNICDAREDYINLLLRRCELARDCARLGHEVQKLNDKREALRLEVEDYRAQIEAVEALHPEWKSR